MSTSEIDVTPSDIEDKLRLCISKWSQKQMVEKLFEDNNTISVTLKDSLFVPSQYAGILGYNEGYRCLNFHKSSGALSVSMIWGKYVDLTGEDGGIHPKLDNLFDDIKSGHTITEFEVENDWKDDHEICLGCRATVNHNTYQFALMWLSMEGVRMAFHAEVGTPEKINMLIQHMLEYVSDC